MKTIFEKQSVEYRQAGDYKIQTVSRFFRNSKIQPFGSRQSSGYDIRRQIILYFEKMVHIHVASGAPVGCRYMTQSGTYEH